MLHHSKLTFSLVKRWFVALLHPLVTAFGSTVPRDGRMEAHRKSDRHRDDLCGVGRRKRNRICEAYNTAGMAADPILIGKPNRGP